MIRLEVTTPFKALDAVYTRSLVPVAVGVYEIEKIKAPEKIKSSDVWVLIKTLNAVAPLSFVERHGNVDS